MAEQIEAKEIGVKPLKALRLWAGILISPTVWAIQLQTLWLTSEYGCFTGDFTWNHVVSAAAFAISILGAAISFSEFRKWNDTSGKVKGDPQFRRRFMAVLGLLSSSLFTAAIFAQWLPTVVGVPCGK